MKIFIFVEFIKKKSGFVVNFYFDFHFFQKGSEQNKKSKYILMF